VRTASVPSRRDEAIGALSFVSVSVHVDGNRGDASLGAFPATEVRRRSTLRRALAACTSSWDEWTHWPGVESAGHMDQCTR
jgi:hypothetical protein